MIDNPALREEIARILADRLHAELERQHDLELQEPNISAGLAGEMRRWDGFDASDWSVSCTAQELEDRAKGSAEDISGADIYIAITVRTPEGRIISKGFLVQAKIGPKPSRTADIVDQCRKMRAKTDGAYVWIYRENDIIVVRADDLLNRAARSRDDWPALSPEDFLERVLACREGDIGLGIPGEMTAHDGLKKRLGELRVPRALSFDILER